LAWLEGDGGGEDDDDNNNKLHNYVILDIYMPGIFASSFP
jgi:hypothetical protein